MNSKTFRDFIYSKETVFGVFAKTCDPLFIEVMGRSGFDFVILDNEHGPNSTRDLYPLIMAAENSNMYPVVRVGKLSDIDIQRTLDLGVAGIQVPQVQTRKHATDVVRHARFHPQGARGVCCFVRPARFSLMNMDDYFSSQNHVVTIIHIEGMEGMRNLEEIIKVDGIDIIFIGPYDLSQSMGIPGAINHPELVKAIEDIIGKCRLRNKYTGIFTNSMADAKRYISLGVKYLAFSADTGIMARACSDFTKELNQIQTMV
jgi:4-hydroxy-2-oxoheptanedioate aldolase